MVAHGEIDRQAGLARLVSWIASAFFSSLTVRADGAHPLRTYVRLFRIIQQSQNLIDRDVTTKPENPRAQGQLTVGTLAFVVDAEDEIWKASLAIERQLTGEIFGGPETNDLEKPALFSIEAMPQDEVWEQESGTRPPPQARVHE